MDNGLSTRFVTHVPQKRDDWDKGFKDKVYHIVTQVLYHHGHVPEKGDNVLKTTSTTFVTHQRPPCYSLLSDSYDPRREVRLSNDPSGTPVPTHQVKETPHETRYVRRTRKDMYQSVSRDEYGNRKGKKNLSEE
jgi:hypothetical protein